MQISSGVRTGALALAALFALYASIVLGEIVTMTPVGAYLRDGIRLSRTALRIVILSATALPIAALVGFALVRWAPADGARAARAAGVGFLLVIAALQATIYEPSVAPASVLKVVFTLTPLWAGAALAARMRRSAAA